MATSIQIYIDGPECIRPVFHTVVLGGCDRKDGLQASCSIAGRLRQAAIEQLAGGTPALQSHNLTTQAEAQKAGLVACILA
jgi:hypothetical protein